VASAARDAVDATFVAVLLDETKRLSAVSIVGDVANATPGGDEASARALQFPESSPSGVALATGQPVIVSDFETDDRFSHWAPESRTYGFSSMVSIPFGHRETPIGVLNAYFTKDHQPDQDDIELLIAYSQQASLMIDRALAYQLEKEAGEQLAESERLKSDFVSTVSHELRTPLTSISGFISTVLLRWDQLDDASKKELLERAAWNGGELRRMVEQVLSFSRLEGGMVDIHPAERRLGTEVRELVDHMLPVLGDHRIDITIPDDLMVMADAEGLHHILWNLLSNAAKFSPAGTPITVSAERQAGVALAAVHDEGHGIAIEERDRVFERFYRSSAGASARGTGIGLTVVRTYVERHGGKVWVESEPGRGSSFFFTLPLADEASAITPLRAVKAGTTS
jgi:two-component system sensor histidine kinase KdpD